MFGRRYSGWALSDVLDYETLLERDDASPPEERICRGRAWYRGYQGSERPRALLRAWLVFRREGPGQVLPGRTTTVVYRVITAGVTALGLVAGSALGWAVLAYGGERPVNLGVALTALIGGPVLFTGISALLMLIPVQGGAPRLFERVARLVRFALRTGRRMGVLERAQADVVAAAVSRFSGRAGPYGALLRWLVAVPVQARASAFQVGILAAVCWRGVVQDLAFAWQTTLQVSPERIHALAYHLALPWRAWVAPPTLAQVAGSRVVLKEGITELANQDLSVWWPYICCAVLCYGVIPRAALLGWALAGRALALARLSFGDAASRRLLLELRSPQVSVEGHEPDREIVRSGGEGEGRTAPARGASVTILVPAARPDLAATGLWERVLRVLWGGVVSSVLPVEQDDEEDTACLKALGGLKGDGDVAVLVVFEGWRPFTTAAGLFVEAVRASVPARIPVMVGLVGRPEGGGRGLEGETTTQWRRMLRVSGDPGGCEVILLPEVA